MNNKGFTYEEIFKYCYKHRIRTPAKILYGWGKNRNWLKNNGEPYQDLAAFINSLNSVWIKLYRNTEQGYWRNKKKKAY